ncbi:hypothetical protein ACIPIN_21585 [Pseudomonas sp. NPDC087697]|uniref:hypothetical protein n=1 Tax=Pseudomonas sp. NPDC087697 TaxID=3364447 RepID=UPI00382711EE
MSTPSTSQKPNEEFNATIKFPTGDFSFKANKINIEKSVDSTGIECWTLAAFQDIFKDPAYKKGLASIKEVIAIQLHIARDKLTDDQQLFPAAIPPLLNKNSGNLSKIVDKIPDKDNLIDTVETYLGDTGHIDYEWDADRTRITGNFELWVGDSNQETFRLFGYFNLLNRGQHLI